MLDFLIKLAPWRPYILGILLSILIAILVYQHAGSGGEWERCFHLTPSLMENDSPPPKAEKKFELSSKAWGCDPFISPIVEKSLSIESEEIQKRQKELEEERRKRRELEEMKRKFEEERARLEEEERRKREEEVRRKKLEEEMENVRQVASRIVAKGLLHLEEGDMVIVGDTGYKVGEKLKIEEEVFRLLKIEEDFIFIEDRFGRTHKVRVLK
ncbi:MAG: hypothetical protein N2234_02670 [Planctomycetota bacterium]|nr:hypothetical protein [Planctomycetota bacterium]